MLFFPFSEDEFQTLQNNFLEKYYHEFDDSEENKFIYRTNKGQNKITTMMMIK
jgi:hypothetical protein